MTMEWLKCALIRAIKTMAQTALALVISSEAVLVTEVDWLQVLSATSLAGLLSILTSLAGLPEIEKKE